MSEVGRIWDLLQRSFEGDVWHGPALRPLLQDVTAEEAAARPIAGAKTIWETVLHVMAHEDACRRRLEGEPVGELPARESWPERMPVMPRNGRPMCMPLLSIENSRMSLSWLLPRIFRTVRQRRISPNTSA